MTIFRPRLFLAVSGAVCLIALAPDWRRPPPELAAIDRSPIGSARVDARLSTTDERIDRIIPFAAAAPAAAIRSLPALDAPFIETAPPRGVGFGSACCVRATPDDHASPAPEQAAASDASLAAHFAYADVPGAAAGESALSAIAPSPPAQVPAPSELPPPPPLGSEAAILYNKGDAAGLAALAKAASDGPGRTALEWASLRASPHPSFAELAAFLKAHPTWPSRGSIRDWQETELAAHPEAPAKVAEFFAGGAPQTSAGKIAAARAARAMGRNDEAARIARSLWRDGNFDALTEGVVLRDFGASLVKADHKYRADRLLYAGYVGAALRAASLAGPDVLALMAARVESARAPTSAVLLRAVPAALRDDPGLLFSRVQYARRAGRIYEAAVLLSLAPRDRAALVSPDRWWSERKMVAAALLDLDEPRLAFEVCDETARPETAEAEVDADFHAGWIALRFLDDPSLAAERFALAAEAADAPLSIARAAYWQGRAAEAMGGAEAARAFYERAASEPIAYYGQLAAQRLGQTRLALRAPKAAAEGDKRDGAVGAAAALYANGLDDLATSLAFDAARQWRDESQIAAMAEVVKRFADAGTQVQFGKFALIRGYPFDAVAFPSSGMPAFLPLARSADLPTVYAVARQESEFIWRSASGAGAKGLMQMLPSTAALTARQAGVEFDYARLIADPSFNTRLGAVLLGQLIGDEGGSRELAFAAYNAGPGRVTQWIAAHGDPRNGTADLIDWIERIPFDETRDYVQRVSENLGVYRQRFADDPPAPAAVSARMARE
jgi:soluble lytic murein transglycosylase